MSLAHNRHWVVGEVSGIGWGLSTRATAWLWHQYFSAAYVSLTSQKHDRYAPVCGSQVAAGSSWGLSAPRNLTKKDNSFWDLGSDLSNIGRCVIIPPHLVGILSRHLTLLSFHNSLLRVCNMKALRAALSLLYLSTTEPSLLRRVAGSLAPLKVLGFAHCMSCVLY